MGIHLRKYTPVGSDLPACEAFAAKRSKVSVDECLAEIGDYLKVKHLFPVSSGRAALYAILKASLEPGSKVVLPGYTCYTVVASVIRAGMVPVLSDSQETDLGFNPSKLQVTLMEHPDVKAIVVCHLFGIAVDIDEIQRIAGPGIMIIDDAAQAYGIKSGDRFLGTGGDAGFYSFGRGKNLSLVGGGLLVTDNDKLAGKINEVLRNEFTPAVSSFGEFIKAALYNLVVAPFVFNIVSRLPGTHLGRSVYNPDFEISGMSDFKVRLLHRIYKTGESLNAERLAVSRQYISYFEGSRSASIPKSRVDNNTGSLRFVLLVDDADKRSRILEAGKKRGWGFSGMYPTVLSQIPELPQLAEFDLKGSENIARSIVTLPTHRFIKLSDGQGRQIQKVTGLSG
jgi:dTDP-4-amino-4,6-dideoxygalactose transaminase